MHQEQLYKASIGCIVEGFSYLRSLKMDFKGITNAIIIFDDITDC
jgi:hypothetical protein